MNDTIQERIANLCPIDDIFFEKLMEDKDVCEEILRVILEDERLVVTSVIPQKSVKNLQGRSVRLDALCVLGDGSIGNVEVQKADDDDHLRRVRYHASCITANITDTGTRFEEVPDVYMVYISKFDMFGKGRTIYHVGPTVRETGDSIDNGLYEVYVNTEIKDGSTISELMECFEQETITNQKFPKLAERVNHFKKEEGGAEIMCGIIEEYANEVLEKGKAEQLILHVENAAKKLGNLEAACDMLGIRRSDYDKAKKLLEGVLV